MKTLICLGDSLTFGLRVPHSQTWPRLLADQTGLTVKNRGISGDTTAGMLARFQTLVDAAQSGEPRILLILGGSNDIFYTGTDVTARANLGALVHQALAAHMLPVVGTPLPICPEDAPAQWSAMADFSRAAQVLEEYSQWLKAFCQAFHIPLVDFRQDFQNPDGTPRRELLLDGLHPNAQGHARMAKRLIEAGVLE